MALEEHPIWPFPANWLNSVSETLEWWTDIITSRSGAEQRRAMRPYPRRYLTFDVALSGRERAYAANLLDTYSGGNWWLPLWHEPHAMGAATVGATTISIPQAASTPWYAAVIWVSPFECEILDVVSAQANSLTLASGISKSYPAGTLVYPAIISHLTDQPSFDKQSDRTWTGEVRFVRMDPDRRVAPDVMTPEYRSYAVITTSPNETSRLNAEYERLMVEMDNKVADPVYLDTADRAFHLQEYSWVISGRQETRDFESLLISLCGRLRPVWLPTFHDDFEVLFVSSTVLTVRNTGYGLTGSPRLNKRDLLIETVNGTFMRRIVAVGVAGANETLTLDEPVTFTVEQVVRVSLMSLVRLNTDTIQVDHLTDTEGTLTCQVTFRSTAEYRDPVSLFA